MVNIYEPKFTSLQQGILRYLFIKSEKSFNARGLAKSLNRTQAGVIKALLPLEKQKLVNLKKDKETKRWTIKINKDNSQIVNLKRVENLKMIYESGLPDYLKEFFQGSTIILFGSYSRGEDVWANEEEGHKSDIDIAIIGSKEKNTNLARFENFLERKIIINFYPSFKEIHKHLKENLFNGIILSGGIEL